MTEPTVETAPLKLTKKQRKRLKKERAELIRQQEHLEKVMAFHDAVRLDERRRFEEEAREWAAEMENEHINAQNVLARAFSARQRMEDANPHIKPLGEAMRDLLEP